MTPAAATPAAKRADELLKRYDKNGDGRIDDDERADAKDAMMKEQTERQMTRAAALPGGVDAFRARMIELFDANKDGRLDDTERAAAQRFAFESGFNPNGELRDETLKRFDRNGNGRIDGDERDALQAFVKERMQAGPGAPRSENAPIVELEKVLRAAIEANAAQLKVYDADQDGRLSDQEWAAIRMRLVPTVTLTPEQEQRRLNAVKAEVDRRRKIRQDAAGTAVPKK